MSVLQSTEELLLIDGNSILAAAYYAIPYLETSSGIPTSATKGFIGSIFKLLERNPTHIAVVFDQGPYLRQHISTDYKANRSPAGEDLKLQMPFVREFLTIMGISYFVKQGYEGDDIIAALVAKFNNSLPIGIVTRDKDLFQLCAFPNVYVKYAHFARGETVTEIITRDTVKSKLGVFPEQIPSYKSLVGKTADNVAGVKSIGPKTAVSLLSTYPDVFSIVSSAKQNELKPARLNALIANSEATILRDFRLSCLIVQGILDDTLSLSDVLNDQIAEAKLRPFFEALELNSFL